MRRLRSLESSLEDAGRLASAGRLLAASTHEVKNLAMLVRIAAQQTVSKCGPAASGDAAKALTALERSSQLLVEVVRGVSDLLGDGGPAARGFDLTALARDVMALMQKRVAPHRLELDGGTVATWARGHEVRIKQVLVNLVLNAVEAIEELAPAEGGSIRIVVAEQGDQASLRVEDNGIGLDVPGERRDFQPFATTKGMRGGSGLGLWLCASLLQRMGGTLRLASAGLGRGAQAMVELPREARENAPGPEIDVTKYFMDLGES